MVSFLLHYNARPQTVLKVKQFLTKQEIVEMNHPPYLPDLAPPDFFLFPRLKTTPKGHRVPDILDIQKNVTATLNHNITFGVFVVIRPVSGLCLYIYFSLKQILPLCHINNSLDFVFFSEVPFKHQDLFGFNFLNRPFSLQSILLSISIFETS